MMRVLLVLVVGCWTGTPPPGPAAAPSQPKPAATKALSRQVAEQLITIEQLRAITGYTGVLELGHSPAPMNEVYDDVHFKATDKTERYDFMLRVWTVGPADAPKKLDELAAELPNVKPLPGVGDRAITAIEGEIFGVAFLDHRGAVALLTCGDAQCTLEQLIRVARGVASRVR